MAILQMQRINIYALNKHCKEILETLQRMGVMQVEQVDIEDSVFYREDTSAFQASYRRSAAAVKSASEILSTYVKYKKSLLSSLEGRKPLSKEEYYKLTDNYTEVLKIAYDIISDNKKIIENKAKIVAYESRLEALSPWQNLDVPMLQSATKTTTSVIGSFQEKLDYETLRLRIAETDPDLELFDLEIVSSDDNQTCIFAVCMNKDIERFNSALRKIGFILPAFDSKLSPQEAIKELKNKIERREKLIEEHISNITAQKDMLDSLNFLEDYFVMKSDRYAQIDNISYSPHTFVMTGYVTKRDSEKLSKLLLEKYDAEVELEDVDGDDVPVVLSNNKFTEPVEGVVLSYSAPHRKEIDPTGIMAVFYYIFFGMMFSDAGYGLVMALACGIAVKVFKNMEQGLKKSLKMFFWCGVSTFFWGLMFGSFFGDAVQVISRTFFGAEAPVIYGITTPIWFNPTEGAGPTKLLMFSFLLGIIHLFAGLILQAVNYVRNGKWLYAIYDDVSWILLVGGAVFALLSTEMLASMAGFQLPPVWLTIGGIMALVGAVLILFCSARNKNPFKRLIKGAYNLYGVTSYLSDILSYSRLLALGLATGVVAQVFNQLGAMIGNSFVGVVAFVLIFVVGHVLNIGINALGAYVHTNRLQFVEFFGKFYEGGGRDFKPYAVNTKYYNIKEDI
ncbi:MAG: V-type ATP synthase subunit I [Clostridia bacterium]|nr:V-type ATP synthase subunit I [Clostridia bacterium]